MPGLFCGIDGLANIDEIYARMNSNCLNPCSTSSKLWLLRRECKICDRNDSLEKMLEKAVANLARKGHMSGWFNQCPTASGITDVSESRRTSAAKGKGRNVDLVFLADSDERLRLVELKWADRADDSSSALWQIVGYGIAYIFCRIHKDKLPLREPEVMDARHVALEVVAPHQFFSRHDAEAHYASVSRTLSQFARSQIGGQFEISLRALSFPAEFKQEFERVFKSGKDVKEKCSTYELSDAGLMVREAFQRLSPAWSEK